MSKSDVKKAHEPMPGRRAYICEHKDHGGVPFRTFSPPMSNATIRPCPYCPKHGVIPRQTNRPYMGQPIPS
jgi:hypothetical protein